MSWSEPTNGISILNRSEWTEVVKNPERRQQFRQFVNQDKAAGERSIEFITERGQKRPANWPKDNEKLIVPIVTSNSETMLVSWVRVGLVDDFPIDGGNTVKVGDVQIAVFRFETLGKWYATQNVF
jgi:hypothetical protein